MGYRQKEACELILDLCMSAPSLAFPLEQNKVEVAKKCADFYIRRFLQEQRKTDQVGIITLGAAGSEEQCMLQSAHLDHRKTLLALQAEIGPSTETLVDAIELAKQKIAERTKTNKYKRTIVLFTDGSNCPANASGLQEAKLNFEDAYGEELVEWLVFGIDFGFAGRDEECVDGEQVLTTVFGSEAIRCITSEEDISHPTKRHVSQVKKWKGEMEVSPYCKFHCVMVARIAEEKLKSLVKRSRLALEDMGGNLVEFLAQDEEGKVKMDRKYTSAEDLDRELEPEERARAFRYGKDLLPMFPGDEELIKLEHTKSCLQVIGIIPRSQLLRNYMISATQCIVADPAAPNSQQGFSAFVIGLQDLDRIATARFVQKDGKNPKFVALIPGMTQSSGGVDCLWHVQIPTMEDIRDYQFDRTAQSMHPTRQQQKATADYVNAMTLGRNDAVQTKQFDPEHTFNPFIARYWEVVHFRAVEPDLPIPAASQQVSAMISVDPKMVKRSAGKARKFKSAFQLKQIVKKKETVAPIDISNTIAATTTADQGEDDDEAWFPDEEKSVVEFVGNINPVEDFWAIMARPGRQQDALKQLQQVVLDMVGPESGDPIYYEKAISCLRAMREGCIKCHTEQKFNDFMLALKDGLLFESPNSQFWRRMTEEMIELIDSTKASQDFYSSSSLSSLNGSTQHQQASGYSQTKIFDEDLFEEME